MNITQHTQNLFYDPSLINSNQDPEFFIRVADQSMVSKDVNIKTFPKDCSILVGRKENLKNGDFVVAKSKNMNKLFFGKYSQSDTELLITFNNPDYQTLKINSKKDIIGVVKGIYTPVSHNTKGEYK